MGLFAALGIWLTPETMPFAMMAFGAVFLAWAADPRIEIAQALERAGAVLLLVTFLALAVDPPSEGFTAIVLDRLSIPFVCLALLVFLLCRLPRPRGPSPLRPSCSRPLLRLRRRLLRPARARCRGLPSAAARLFTRSSAPKSSSSRAPGICWAEARPRRSPSPSSTRRSSPGARSLRSARCWPSRRFATSGAWTRRGPGRIASSRPTPARPTGKGSKRPWDPETNRSKEMAGPSTHLTCDMLFSSAR